MRRERNKRKIVDVIVSRPSARELSRAPNVRIENAEPIFKRKGVFATASIGILGLLALLPLLSAFEAHVINVTATIERPPNQCDAKSIGYWRNHEGCFAGTGESDWRDEVNALSSTFSGVFAAYSGNQICEQVFMPLCGPGVTVEGQRCRAKAHTLADELNVVSARLDLNAWIAFADDGSDAFDNLGLVASSTVSEALAALEGVISDPNSSRGLLEDASHVAQRIYAFYEEENPLHPRCIFNDDDLAACKGLQGAAQVTEAEAESSSGVTFPPVTFSQPEPVSLPPLGEDSSQATTTLAIEQSASSTSTEISAEISTDIAGSTFSEEASSSEPSLIEPPALPATEAPENGTSPDTAEPSLDAASPSPDAAEPVPDAVEPAPDAGSPQEEVGGEAGQPDETTAEPPTEEPSPPSQ